MNQITGTIVRMGVLDVDGEKIPGFFVRSSPATIREISMQGLYGKAIYVQADRRRPDRPVAPTFQRLKNQGKINGL